MPDGATAVRVVAASPVAPNLRPLWQTLRERGAVDVAQISGPVSGLVVLVDLSDTGTSEDWGHGWSTTAEACFLTLQGAIRAAPRAGGAISVALTGFAPDLPPVAYAAAGAIRAMVRALTLDLHSHGLRINAVIGHGGSAPEDIAAALLWLVGPEASFVTGTVLEVGTSPAPPAAPRPAAGLAGRRIAVTGGAGDIGGAVVDGLRTAGAEAISIDLAANPAASHSLVCDLADPMAITRAFDGLGPLDGLACIAGIKRSFPLATLSLPDFRAVMDVNVRGMHLAIAQAQPLLAGRPGAAIVAMASISAHMGTVASFAYHTSKGGALGLVAGHAPGLAARGIRINAISPAYVNTRFTHGDKTDEAARTALAARARDAHVLGRMAEAAEVAAGVLFLLGAAPFTGREVFLDGGFMCKA